MISARFINKVAADKLDTIMNLDAFAKGPICIPTTPCITGGLKKYYPN